MNEQKNAPYILGLDVGASSVGWAMLAAESTPDAQVDAKGLAAAGVRVFEAGVEGDIEKGKDESRGIQRRDARSARRRLDRLARRLNALFFLLQRTGLLPTGPCDSRENPKDETRARQTARERKEQRIVLSQRRDRALTELDQVLVPQWQQRLRSESATNEKVQLVPHVLPYLLRARALDQRLEPHEIGRALYHLGQRRGFASNRKAAPKKDKKAGEVQKGINELTQQMASASARTLGEFFASLDPHEHRIRGRWTSRKMYADEFDKIWSAQQPHYPHLLTDDLSKRIHKVIFYQRPLKIRKEFIGDCELESGRKRAPMTLLAAQRFRLLQQVNHTTIRSADGQERPLKTEERATLIEALETHGDLEFTTARGKKYLNLPKSETFNFEEGGEKRFLGNRTASKLAVIFGKERWAQLTDAQRDHIVHDLLSIQKDAVLERRGREKWALDAEAAAKLAAVQLEPGHCRLSRQALAKLLPLMEQGEAYATARLKVYGDQPPPRALDLLPPVAQALPELRNPAVSRAITELRKVVNAIVRKYGKPAAVRIELGRDLRRNRKQREETWKKNRDNEKARQDAANKILAQTGDEHPSRGDKLKVLLAEECNWQCPYTGQGISMAALLGPQFDIEHIIPLGRSLDDSYMNKTLCEHNENVHRKRDHTPWEAYHAGPQWNEILERVKRFKGRAARVKLARFQMDDKQLANFLENYTQSQLNDMRHASRLATKYVGLLYGDRAASCVQASRGGVTAFLRNEWNLNSILGDGGEKSRDDHRHHAVDALVIALTERRTVQLLSDAAARAAREGRRRFAPIPPPWPSFLDDVRSAIANTVVSHRVSRKVQGKLHEETHYGPGPEKDKDGKPLYYHVRKPIDSLSKSEMEDIVDPAVKQRVLSKLQEMGGDLAKFKYAENHPYLETRKGLKIPIHKVRIRKTLSTFSVGSGPRERHVKTESNHHVEILEVVDQKGRVKWEGRVISRFEALLRHKAGKPVVERGHGPQAKFVFSLAQRETVLMKDEQGEAAYYTVTGISENERGAIILEFRRNRDARPATVLRKIKGGRVFRTPNSLRDSDGRKVTITPLGEVRWAND